MSTRIVIEAVREGYVARAYQDGQATVTQTPGQVGDVMADARALAAEFGADSDTITVPRGWYSEDAVCEHCGTVIRRDAHRPAWRHVSRCKGSRYCDASLTVFAKPIVRGQQ